MRLSPGGKIATRAKEGGEREGGREARGGERDFVTVRLEAHVCLNTERCVCRESGKEKEGDDKERERARNSKESSFCSFCQREERDCTAEGFSPPFFMAVVDKLATPPPPPQRSAMKISRPATAEKRMPGDRESREENELPRRSGAGGRGGHGRNEMMMA